MTTGFLILIVLLFIGYQLYRIANKQHESKPEDETETIGEYNARLEEEEKFKKRGN